MANLPYQSDLMVTLPTTTGQKSTLALSPTGNLQLVTGKDKLITQIVHAVVNDQTLSGIMINSPVGDIRAIKSTIFAILRQFRETQLSYTRQSDPDLSGFSIWRKDAGNDEDFARISNMGVQFKFVDTNVLNGNTYVYGVSKVYKSTVETKFVDMITIGPSAFVSSQTVVLGSCCFAMNLNRQVIIYVDYNKYFKASEILNTIVDVQVLQDSVEPRKYAINIKLENLLGDPVNVSAIKQVAANSVTP
jgi:hypothetical protein